MSLSIETAISDFGKSAKSKLANPAASGQPEDQLRAPFERLLEDVAAICNFHSGAVVAVGETTQADLKTRPDYSITVNKALVGFVELKAPGKGANPARFKDPHDKEQWERLRSLPNLLYTDGNSFGLWQDGKAVGSVLTLQGDIETSGAKLAPPAGLLLLFESFLQWQPVAPRSARELAHTTARLCRLLRDEVTEQLGLKSQALTDLATDWRKLLFPDATDERFADGYAQAVTFGMLMARAKDIPLSDGLNRVATELARSSTLIGAALRLLTDNAENQETLKTALGTLTRVLDAVEWKILTKGVPDAWLYFYEEFLDVYDSELRKETGSYYTPPQVVGAMVALVDEALRGKRFGLHGGLASPSVTLADPAMGTGTFLLGVLRRIAETLRSDEGPGAVPSGIQSALSRLIGFEIQLGPFAVAQLRLLAEVVDLTDSASNSPLRIFVTNTLGDPYENEDYFPSMLAALGRSRRDANKIKREEPITVVLGNPPYKEKAMGRGGWIEHASPNKKDPPPLLAWMPPQQWRAGAHSKHLRNLYVYFWRWATWKVFDQQPAHDKGIVCFITVAGFLAGPGFQKMRDYMRRTCDDIWVIDCSPEGHQPEVKTRIFQGVQQPVCVVMLCRSKTKKAEIPATVHFRALPLGNREVKFESLVKLRLNDENWVVGPSEWRAPFLPASQGAWAAYPRLEDLFTYNGSGVQPKRTWVIAPDVKSLENRWNSLIRAESSNKEELFHPTLRDGLPADRHIRSIVKEGIPGFPPNLTRIIDEIASVIPPVRYAFRSFNRQWIIPDARVITQPNAELWQGYSDSQIFLTALTRTAPRNGPAVTFTSLLPDLDHYRGSFGGRVFPLWRDDRATSPNFPPYLLTTISERLGLTVTPEDLLSYIAAVAANPAYTSRFQKDLSTPGLRIPITANPSFFQEAVGIGQRVLWLQTFGERMTNAARGRPGEPPRLPAGRAPFVPKEGAISSKPEEMPDSLGYDAGNHRLLIGTGFVDKVIPAVWEYEVSGKQVLLQWFSYRKRHRERPIIGDRRQPSALGDIQPDHWLPEYTTELLNLLNVLTMLVELEPQQAELLDRICSGKLISEADLKTAGAFEVKATPKPRRGKTGSGGPLFE
ncbi:MAG: type ISP restriction/modification enzyme [Candidatus Acidiferrales bacterium]